MKHTLIVTAIALLCSAPAVAQTSVGVYGGTTTPTPSLTTMVMADYGTKFDIEPWLQTYGRDVQVGADLIVTAYKGFGVTVGAYSNTFTQRYGITYSKGNGQVRVLRTVSGAWQGIGYYNFNLTPKTYFQLWAAPAQGGSSYLVGVGHIFKP